jgi:hypothetical protein
VTHDEKLQLLHDACTRLSEHFDNIQIFASQNPIGVSENHDTNTYRVGIGNWWARVGQVRDFVDGLGDDE